MTVLQQREALGAADALHQAAGRALCYLRLTGVRMS